MKFELKKRFKPDRNACTAAKGGFIRACVKKAREKYGKRKNTEKSAFSRLKKKAIAVYLCVVCFEQSKHGKIIVWNNW